jgi:hypothetical protein
LLQVSTREAGTNLLAMTALLATAPAWAEPAQSRVSLVRQSIATARTSTPFSFVPSRFGTAWLSEAPLRFETAPVYGYRPTTQREQIIGQLRAWSLLRRNWDAEGASAPILASLKQASLFVNLLSASAPMPEPMLHANGRAGLYWNEAGLYADLEFLGDSRVSYYIERQSAHGKDKHKGAVTIIGSEMPPVFAALLRT